MNITQQLPIHFLDGACRSFNEKLASCGKLLTGESRDAQFQRFVGLNVGFMYILAENIVAKLTWTAVIGRICTCCCDCHQAADEGVRLKVKPARAASRSGWKLRFTFGLSIVHVIEPKIAFENHETATESCSSLTRVEVFTNSWS